MQDLLLELLDLLLQLQLLLHNLLHLNKHIVKSTTNSKVILSLLCNCISYPLLKLLMLLVVGCGLLSEDRLLGNLRVYFYI